MISDRTYAIKVKLITVLSVSILIYSWVSTSRAEQIHISDPYTCEQGMHLVDSDAFASATKVGEHIVVSFKSVSYKSIDAPVLRIQQGFNISINQNFGGIAVKGKSDVRKAYSKTTDGKTLKHVFRDTVNIYHKAVRFAGIENNILVVENLDGGKERIPFDSNKNSAQVNKKNC